MTRGDASNLGLSAPRREQDDGAAVLRDRLDAARLIAGVAVDENDVLAQTRDGVSGILGRQGKQWPESRDFDQRSYERARHRVARDDQRTGLLQRWERKGAQIVRVRIVAMPAPAAVGRLNPIGDLTTLAGTYRIMSHMFVARVAVRSGVPSRSIATCDE